MMRKYWMGLVGLGGILASVLLITTKHMHNRTPEELLDHMEENISSGIPFVYNKEYVSPLGKLKGEYPEIGALQELSATFYGESGNDPGDILKVQFQLNQRKMASFEYAAWIKVLEISDSLSTAVIDHLKIPTDSRGIQLHAYCITLALENNAHIVMLFGWPYASQPGLLTLIYVDEDNAELVFNKEVKLREIQETAIGYRLVGQTGHYDHSHDTKNKEYPDREFEILISDKQLSFALDPNWPLKPNLIPISYDTTHINPEINSWEFRRTTTLDRDITIKSRSTIEKPSVNVTQWDGEGWDAKLGDFSAVYFTLPNKIKFTFSNFDGGWANPSPSIQVPASSAKVTQHTHGISLEMGGDNHILILTGKKYDESIGGWLTLLFVGEEDADIIFNKKMDLCSVEETSAGGYRLRGILPDHGTGEIMIENGALTFEEME